MTEPPDRACPDCNGGSVADPFTIASGTLHAPSGTNAFTPGSDDPVLLQTRPRFLSFSARYLMAFTPVILVVLSVFVQAAMESMVRNFIPNLPGPLSAMMPDVNDLTLITVYLVAPVLLFLLVAAIGYDFKRSEVWAGTLLAFGASIAIAFLFTFTSPGTAAGTGMIRLFLQWTAYLVQPCSLIAAVLILAGVEKYRRSIIYTVTRDGVMITSGLWGHHEHMIPVQMIGRIEISQGFFGKWFHFGTVIPHTMTGFDPRSAVRGGRGIGIQAAGSRELPYGPADCLYGIPDPDTAEQLLIRLIARKKSP